MIKLNTKVFGITGTNGKTSVTYMLRSIITSQGKESALIGTVMHQVGSKQYEAKNTTPGFDELKKYFEIMKSEEIPYCIMEVSSHGLAQNRVENVEFTYGAFTNLTQDHLDYHSTMEEYFQQKKKLFMKVKKGCIINIDDCYGKRLVSEIKRERGNEISVYTCSSRNKEATYYGENEKNDLDGSIFRLYEKGKFICKVSVNIPGEYSIRNGLTAIGLARMEGFDYCQIRKGLNALGTIPGRFERIEIDENIVAIVDFAHTPDALESLLSTVTLISDKKNKIICVFGCGGNRDKEKRKMMGRVAGQYSDYCILTSDNPRNEEPMSIINEITEGVYDTGCPYEIIADRKEAINKAVCISQKWCIILIAGKGHEKYQILGDDKIPFDDVSIVKEAKVERDNNRTNM